MSALKDFVLFLLGCWGDAFIACKWILGLITMSGFFLWLWYRKHDHEDETVKKKKQKITTFLYWLCCLLPLYAIFIAPYVRYREANHKSLELAKKLEDNSPKLDGFIDQTITGQIANTNIMIFQVSIGNAGHFPSMAEGFRLRVYSKNHTNEADLIDISDTYRQTVMTPNRTLALTLKRSELIAEKTMKAIQPGDSQRGWIAFTSTNVTLTNSTMVLSFLDILGKRINVTNQYRHGEFAESKAIDLPMHLPGSESILSVADAPKPLGWMPPELPAGCTNVTLIFGGQAFTYPLAMVSISPEGTGTPFSINELPDYLLKDIDKTPGYSPRMTKMWIRWGGIQQQYGPTTLNLPFVPYIVSNRLYLYVEVPFQSGKHRLVMSDDFDSELSSLPRKWDRNFHTNFYAYEIVNENTNPVLQVAYPSANVILVNGLFIENTNQFLEAFWHPPQLMTVACTVINPTNMEPIPQGAVVLALGTNSEAELVTNAMYNWSFPTRKAWFKYPSNRNRSVFADDNHVFSNQ